MASLVVFGGETITRTGQTAYMNDVWLYTPHTGAWREVRKLVRVCAVCIGRLIVVSLVFIVLWGHGVLSVLFSFFLFPS